MAHAMIVQPYDVNHLTNEKENVNQTREIPL